MRIRRFIPVLALLAFAAAAAAVEVAPVQIRVLAEPLHAGRISPLLYGNFMELLDDVIPGMWAEMLGNRGFEGVEPTAGWVYHKGGLNLMDRDWDPGATWSVDAEKPWNAQKSARITAAAGRPGRLE